MTNVNTYDIETFNENNFVIPYCVCSIIENKEVVVYYEESFDIIIESFKIISKIVYKNDVVIYIHNINFDGNLIINSLTTNNIYFDMLIKDLNIYSISFNYLGTNFLFKCSYKIIPISLKNILISKLNKTSFPYKFSNKENLWYIGDCPDVSYFESKDDYNLFKDSVFNFKEESIKYCLNDVYVLKNIMTDFIETLYKINKKYVNYLNKSYSIPSFSNKIFYNFFNTYGINKKITMEMSSYIYKSYFGGRCEIFGNIYKDEKIHYFDYTGMYAQCMLEKFPIGEPYFDFKIDKIDKPGFYYIKFKSDINIPVLPYKSKKLYFPNGELEGVYWYEEILEFIKNNGIVIKYEYAILYEKEESVFKEFVECFTKMRSMGGYYKIIGKLIINSLYGSFGMKTDENFSIITYSEKEFNDILENTNVESYSKLNNCFIIKIKKDYKSKKLYNKKNKKWNDYYNERNVAYASIIASKARIKLYRSLKDVINDGGRLLYCDTDSIFASYKENKINMPCGSDIIWSELYNDGLFILPKTYLLKNEKKEILKFKGVDIKDLRYDDFMELIKKDKIIFENQLTFYKKNMVLKQKYIEKNILLKKYDKRIMFNDMRDSKPIKINPHL